MVPSFGRKGVPFRGKIDVRITPATSNDIQRIEVDYLWDDAAQRKPPPLDTTPMVDLVTLAIEATPSASFVERSNIPQPSSVTSTSTFVAPASTPISRPP